MFNPLSKSRKLWAGLDSWGAVNMANTIQGRRSPSIYFDCLSIKRPNSGTPRSHVKIATLRPQQAAIHCAQLPGTRLAPGPGGVGHGRTSRPCNPVSTRRARGLANATESQDSQLCYRHTQPPVCASPPPAKLPPLAPGCVEHGKTSARAKPAHTRHPCGLAKRKSHRRWR